MKTKTASHLTLALPLLVFLSFSFQAVNSQNVTPNNGSAAFSGSDYKLESAVSRADAIFVGEITQIGGPTLSAAGGAEYSGNQIKVSQVLRGAVDAQVTVAFKIVERAKEQIPNVGSSYIFFANKVTNPDPDPYKAFKLLPATEDNITKVKAVIADAPAGK